MGDPEWWWSPLRELQLVRRQRRPSSPRCERWQGYSILQLDLTGTLSLRGESPLLLGSSVLVPSARAPLGMMWEMLWENRREDGASKAGRRWLKSPFGERLLEAARRAQQ